MTTDFTQMNTKAWITPAENLIAEWWKETRGNVFDVVCLAAQWGADQELEACCELTRDNDGYDAALGLRAARRPEPLSLKEQALEALADAAYDLGAPLNPVLHEQINTIRRALEQLNDADAPAPKTVHAVVNTAAEAKKRSKKPKKYRRHLSADTVRQIKTALDSGMSNSNVARLYSVHYSTVLKIARGQTYKNVVM